MKVGLYTANIDLPDSGPSIYRENLANALLDQKSSKDELVLIHHQKNDNDLYDRTKELITPQPRTIAKRINRGLGVDNIPATGYNPFLEIYLSFKYDFDLLHLQSFPFWRPYWAGDPSTKILATVHFGVRRFLHPDHYGVIDRLIRTKLPQWSAPHLDAMITVSEESKKLHSKYLGINPDKIFVTHNAVPTGFRPLRDRNTLAKYGIERPYIFHLSNSNFYKNPKGIVHGYRKAVENYGIEHQLVLAGGGWNESDFNTYTNKAEIRERMTFLGHIPRSDIPPLYTDADFFFLPSLSEGFPFVILEAMACGTPVLTTAQFGMPDLVGDAGVYISNPYDYDRIAEKINNIISKGDLGTKPQKQAEKYSWNKTADKTWKIYRDLVEE